MVYHCDICGKEHEDLPMDIAFRKPVDYFDVPEAERVRRVKINDDLCVIDDKVFFIRAYLPIRVHNSKQKFAWGVWVIVERGAYNRYLELWNEDGSKEPPFRGRLSARMPGYPDAYGLEANVYLRSARERPTVRLRPADHPLVHEQKDGITMARVHEILEAAFPDAFGKR